MNRGRVDIFTLPFKYRKVARGNFIREKLLDSMFLPAKF